MPPNARKSGAARIPGFWATHTTITSGTLAALGGNIELCGTRAVNSTAKVTGGFWSSMPFKSDGVTRRSLLDQARMQLIQQLLAAILNVQAFGTNDGGLIVTAETNYYSTDRGAILTSAEALALFNQSGDAITPSNFSPGAADSQTAQAIADRQFWGVLP